MKKKIVLTLFISCALGVAVITSCKKNDSSSSTSNPQLDAQSKQNNEDRNNYKSESDQNNNDVNGALGGSSLMNIPVVNSNGNMERLGTGGGTTIQSNPVAPCGSTIDSSQISSKIIKFNFDGTTHCGLRVRSGQIVVQLSGANKWDSAEAVLTITFNNYKVTRWDNGHWMQFNGVKTLIDPNGFNWLLFALGNTNITYKERVDTMHVSFDDGSHAVWNSSRTVTWKCNNYFAGDFTVSTIGDTVINSFNNTSEWGTNRFNTAFVIYYNSALVANSLCLLSYWSPISGEVVYDILNGSTVAGSFMVDVNVDSHGAVLTSGCPTYFKITWTDSNHNTQNTVLPYL